MEEGRSVMENSQIPHTGHAILEIYPPQRPDVYAYTNPSNYDQKHIRLGWC